MLDTAWIIGRPITCEAKIIDPVKVNTNILVVAIAFYSSISGVVPILAHENESSLPLKCV